MALAIPIPIVFGIILLMALIVYGLATKMAPPARKGESETTYACGEDLPPDKNARFYVHFFNFAVFFIIFDIVAFMVLTAWMVSGSAALLLIIYLVVVSVAIVLLPRI